MSPRSIRHAVIAAAMLMAGPVPAFSQPSSTPAPSAQVEETKSPATGTTAPSRESTGAAAAADTLPPRREPAPAASTDAPRTEDIDFGPEPAQLQAQQQNGGQNGGLLGESMLLDVLMLLAASIVGALIALMSPWSRSAERLHAPISGLAGKLKRIETGLKAQSNLSTPAPPPAGLRNEPVDTRRRETSHEDASAASLLKRDARPSAPASSNQQEHERNSKMQLALDEYAKLVATKGTKPRQFTQVVADFPQAHAVRVDQVHGLAAEPFREGDANQFVVAVGDGQRFAVVPTYEYISDFSIAFSAPVQNPDAVRQLFEFASDDTGQLRIERAAVVEIDEKGAVQIVRRGLLSGFRS
jgi:hypothetical protein